jgi:basic membrane protein A
MLTRREFHQTFMLAAASFLIPKLAFADPPLRVSMFLPGKIDDGGFMEAGYRGLLMARDQLDAEISYIDQTKPEFELQVAALRRLAAAKPDLVIAHGGQNSQSTAQVAAEFPELRFVVVQGNVTGDNLASYEVLQEQSAWLAGAASGLLTETNVVGHISGIRVTPGLRGRAGFADGLWHTNPEAQFLTIFNGSQDDVTLAKTHCPGADRSGCRHHLHHAQCRTCGCHRGLRGAWCSSNRQCT